MINIDLQNIYINNTSDKDLYCLAYMDNTILGCPVKIHKSFKSFQELKMYCEDNNSSLRLYVTNLTPEQIEQLEKYPNTDYTNID
jgi:hypothetical protein